MQLEHFTFGDRFFPCTWNSDLEPIITGAPSVQHSKRLFHDRFSVSKNDTTLKFFQNICGLVVVARGEQKRNSSLKKPE